MSSCLERLSRKDFFCLYLDGSVKRADGGHEGIPTVKVCMHGIMILLENSYNIHNFSI